MLWRMLTRTLPRLQLGRSCGSWKGVLGIGVLYEAWLWARVGISAIWLLVASMFARALDVSER